MRRFIGKIARAVLASVFGALLLPGLSVGQTPAPASIRVHEFTSKGYLLEVIRELATKYRVVIGVYSFHYHDEPATIDITVKDGTLADALNAIANADQRLVWHQSSNGAIHFVSRTERLSLMDVNVHSFDAYDFQNEMLDQLLRMPEFGNWFHEHHCPNNWSDMIIGGQGTLGPVFSVHAQNTPVYVLLDDIAAKSHSYYWSLIRYNKCGFVLDYTAPEPE